VDEKVMPFLKTEDTGIEVFPMVNNFDGTDWVDVASDSAHITLSLTDTAELSRSGIKREVRLIPGNIGGVPQRQNDFQRTACFHLVWRADFQCGYNGLRDRRWQTDRHHRHRERGWPEPSYSLRGHR